MGDYSGGVSSSYRFRSGVATDVGHRRDTNEDSYGTADDLFIVADGMGGHDAGEVASALTVKALLTGREEHGDKLVELTDLQQWLTTGNKEVFDYSNGRAGTTVTLLCAVKHEGVERLAVINVGDSRTYLYRSADEQLVQLTEDHSVVQEMLRSGHITADEARHHRAKNMITRAVGSQLRLTADVMMLDAAVGDRFLLCSDGLSNAVDHHEIGLVLTSAQTPQDAADTFIEQALDLDGSDNITAVVVEVLDAPPETDHQKVQQ